MIKNITVFGICMLAVSCMNPQKLMTDPSKDRICFGRSGGFTNIPLEYVLFEKGQLFKAEQDSLFKVHKISTKQIKLLDSLFTKADFEKLELNNPGNVTYYIKRIRSGSEREVIWSDPSENEPVRELYNALMKLTKKESL
ncbi:MAG: hypothetical protein JW830_09955 [Bacteroidales bacterium]|nr:hypothetical protein [Bacteroidales bacterium]